MNSNPFNSSAAIAASCYTGWRNDRVVNINSPESLVPREVDTAHRQFRAMMTSADFPSELGRAAIKSGNYRFGLYPNMGTNAGVHAVCRDLFTYVQERPSMPTDYATFISAFRGPPPQDEMDFESLLWKQLQEMHKLDAPFHGWDAKVSSNPTDPRFSFSIAETAFFVVGFHSAASRPARRFPFPTLVFNLQYQFERLVEKGIMARMQSKIRANDVRLAGTVNPNLAEYFGEKPENREYSGRKVEANWKCPFHIVTDWVGRFLQASRDTDIDACPFRRRK